MAANCWIDCLRLLEIVFGFFNCFYNSFDFCICQDIVTESSQNFNLEAFIPLLKERVYVKNSFARQYVISWISILNAVPEINMINYLTDILDGLFTMLDDNTIEIQRMCVRSMINAIMKKFLLFCPFTGAKPQSVSF